MAPPPTRLEVKIAAGQLWENDRWQATHFRVRCQLGDTGDSLLKDQLRATTKLIEGMLAGHSRFSKEIAVGRRDANLSQPPTSPTGTARHRSFNYHSHGREPGVERLAPQRAPLAGRHPSSKPPTTAGHHRWAGPRRPLEARGCTACLCLNCTTAGRHGRRSKCKAVPEGAARKNRNFSK